MKQRAHPNPVQSQKPSSGAISPSGGGFWSVLGGKDNNDFGGGPGGSSGGNVTIGCVNVTTSLDVLSSGQPHQQVFMFSIRNTFHYPINITDITLWGSSTTIVLYYLYGPFSNAINSLGSPGGWTQLPNVQAQPFPGVAQPLFIQLSPAGSGDGQDQVTLYINDNSGLNVGFFTGASLPFAAVDTQLTLTDAGLLVLTPGVRVLSSDVVNGHLGSADTNAAFDFAGSLSYCTSSPFQGCGVALPQTSITDVVTVLQYAVHNYIGRDTFITDMSIPVPIGQDISGIYYTYSPFNDSTLLSTSTGKGLNWQPANTIRTFSNGVVNAHFFPALLLPRSVLNNTIMFYIHGNISAGQTYLDSTTGAVQFLTPNTAGQDVLSVNGLVIKSGLGFTYEQSLFGAANLVGARVYVGNLTFCTDDGTCGKPCVGFNRVDNPLPANVQSWGTCTKIVECGVPCNCLCDDGYDLNGRPWLCHPDLVGQTLIPFGAEDQSCQVGSCPLGYVGRGLNCSVDPGFNRDVGVSIQFLLLYGFNDAVSAQQVQTDPATFKAQLLADLTVALLCPASVFDIQSIQVQQDGIAVTMNLDVAHITDNRTAVDVANELKKQVNLPTSALYSGVVTRYLDPSSFIAILIALLAGLGYYYVIGILGGLTLIFCVFFILHRRRHPQAETILFIAVLWSMVVFASNIYFVIFLADNLSAFPEFTDHYHASIAFLAGPFVINLFLSFWVTRRELQTNTELRAWINKYCGSFSAFILLSGIKTSNLRISLSGVMGLPVLSAPWSIEADLLLKSLGLVGTLLSDTPLGIIMIIMLNTNHGYDERVLFPLCAILLSVLLALITRTMSTVRLVRHRKTRAAASSSSQGELEKPGASSPKAAVAMTESLTTDPEDDTSKPKVTSSSPRIKSSPPIERDSDILSIGDRYSTPAFPTE